MLEQPDLARIDEPVPDPLAFRVLAVAGVTGLAYALLAHDVEPGIGWATLLVGIVGASIWISRGGVGRQSLRVLGAAGIMAVFLGIRDLPALAALNTLAYLSLISLAMGLERRPALQTWSVSTLLRETAVNAFGAAAEPPRYLRTGVPDAEAILRTAQRRAGPVVAGLGLSVFVVLVFGGLLVSADAVFAELSDGLLEWATDRPQMAGRVFAAIVVAWLMLGVLARLRRPREAAPGPAATPEVEPPVVLIPRWVLNLRFAAFVVIQFAYLFGGADTVASTGLTYAQYARRGFFELVAVAALVVLVVLVADWLSRNSPRRRAVVLGSRVLIGLTLAIGVAAVRRMLLYVGEFGLTELRVYTTTFLLWVGFVLAWLLATVLSDRGERFAIGAVVSAFVLTVGLNLAHPAALIANVNLDRAVAGGELDVDYLLQLGSGAVPTIEERLEELPAGEEQALLAEELRRRAGPADWRAASWDDLAAHS